MTYLPWLEAYLPDRYESDLFVVGRINGALEALAHLNNQVNHAPSFGFVEIEVGAGGPVAALRERYAHVGSPLSLTPLRNWRQDTQNVLRRVAVDECEPLAPLRESLFALIDDIVAHLAALFGPATVEAFAVQPQGGRGIYGYISDDTLAFVAAGRLYVLGLGWSD